MVRAPSVIAALVAAVIVVVVGVVTVANWTGIGDAGISLSGWIALTLGILATLGVGIGLMALVFISNRRGYDEPPGGRR
jgi:hypothetical protein